MRVRVHVRTAAAAHCALGSALRARTVPTHSEPRRVAACSRELGRGADSLADCTRRRVGGLRVSGARGRLWARRPRVTAGGSPRRMAFISGPEARGLVRPRARREAALSWSSVGGRRWVDGEGRGAICEATAVGVRGVRSTVAEYARGGRAASPSTMRPDISTRVTFGRRRGGGVRGARGAARRARR